MFSKFEVAVHNWVLLHLKGREGAVRDIFEEAYLQHGFEGLLSALHSAADTFHSNKCEDYTECPKCMKFFKLL